MLLMQFEREKLIFGNPCHERSLKIEADFEVKALSSFQFLQRNKL